jgi:hypothetical protein
MTTLDTTAIPQADNIWDVARVTEAVRRGITDASL